MFKVASFHVALVATAAAVWLFSGWLVDELDIPRPNLTLDLVPRVVAFRNSMKHDRARFRVAMMGDSMIFTEWPGKSVPSWVEDELKSREGTPRTSVHVISYAAWGTAPEYCMADEIAKAKPDLLVLELNLRLLGPAPLGIVSYPELAGHIANDRLLEAAFLPLSHAGITLGKLLFHRSIVLSQHELHLRDIQMRQAKVFHLRETLEEWLDAKTGRQDYSMRKFAWGIGLSNRYLERGKKRSRDNPSHARDALGDVLDGIPEDHPRLVVFGAMLADFKRRGVPVLVWVSPINLDHLNSLGLDTSHVDASISTIRKIVERHGARFVDLHALLHDAEFFDAGDHYTREGSPSGAQLVGQELGQAIGREEDRLAVQ